jgi:hypothetical protein
MRDFDVRRLGNLAALLQLQPEDAISWALDVVDDIVADTRSGDVKLLAHDVERASREISTCDLLCKDPRANCMPPPDDDDDAEDGADDLDDDLTAE